MWNRLTATILVVTFLLCLDVRGESDNFFETGVQREIQHVQQMAEFQPKPRQEAVARSSRGYSVTVEATAYTPHDFGCTGIAYDGRPAIPGRTVAVDPKVIPLGSRVYVAGWGWGLAHDIGGDIQGMRVDLCFGTRGEALKFGRRQMEVWVEPPATPHKMR